jgi:hypothetical protein
MRVWSWEQAENTQLPKVETEEGILNSVKKEQSEKANDWIV